jgi:hypothetical protein
MKTILTKTEEGYALFTQKNSSTHREFIATIDGMYVKYKLSKENCDSIFGVVDVERLTEEIVTSHPDFKTEGFSDYQNGKLNGIIEGFNKAVELQKDKLYTIEDVKKAIAMARKGSQERLHTGYGNFTQPISIFVLSNTSSEEIIQSLQQPTEIEVRIAMGCSLPNGCTEPDVECTCEPIYNLDENGCLRLWVLNTQKS